MSGRRFAFFPQINKAGFLLLWGCIALLVAAGKKFFGTPLWAEIHRDNGGQSRTTRLISVASEIARALGAQAYLVLDAFFAVGPAFEAARATHGLLHIVTRAKKNVVAYLPPPPRSKRRKGRPRKYGGKLSLMKLFDDPRFHLRPLATTVYGSEETVRALTLDLLWKPVKTTLRFILIVSKRGPIILMTKPISTRPRQTANTLAAIEKFLAIQITVVGLLHLLARHFPSEILRIASCWLRTPCGPTPSEFVTRTALSKAFQTNLRTLAKNPMTQLILAKQHHGSNTSTQRKAA